MSYTHCELYFSFVDLCAHAQRKQILQKIRTY